MKTSTCTCHTPDVCETRGGIERPRYFPRQILTPAEMTLEQQYFRDRHRRHNRLLHGWGVVCGAEVCRVPEEPKKALPGDPRPPAPPPPPKPQPWKVRVKPGYILGPFGDEILIDQARVVDLRTLGVICVSDDHGDEADPFCAQVFAQPSASTLYVAVRYKELQGRPVRVQPAGCGCDDAPCEFSRLVDGFEIGVLSECPESHHNPPSLENLFEGPMPDCPDCPTSPWVVLAKVVLDPDGTIKLLDNCACRRIVLSAGPLWWQCTLPTLTVAIDGKPEPNSDITLKIKPAAETDRLPESPRVDLEDLEVRKVTVADDRKLAEVEVHIGDVKPGPRALTLSDGAGCVAFRVEAAVVVQLAPGGLVEPVREPRSRGRARRG